MLHKSRDVLTFETSYAGKLQIRWSEVRSITTDSPVRVMLEGEHDLRSVILGPGGIEPGQIRYEIGYPGKYIDPGASGRLDRCRWL